MSREGSATHPENPAVRIERALRSLGGDVPSVEMTPPLAFRLIHDICVQLDCLNVDSDQALGWRRSRWRFSLRRALLAAGAAYARAGRPESIERPELLAELERLPLEVRESGAGVDPLPSALELAKPIASAEPGGLRSILVLGGSVPFALALARMSGHPVTLARWASQAGAQLEDDALERLRKQLGFEVTIQDPLHVGEALPSWLQGRFQSVVARLPLDGIGSRKALRMGLDGLERTPGRRFYWLGQVGRHFDYFGLFSELGRRGWHFHSLVPDVLPVPIAPAFRGDLIDEVEHAAELDGRVEAHHIEDLLCTGLEYEHLHLFRPAAEVGILGKEIELFPLLESGIPQFDAWLTPQFCGEIGLEDDQPRPTREGLRREHWYPGAEWWVLKAKDGRGVGIVKMDLRHYWTGRFLSWDIGIVDKTLRGRGLLDDIFRVGFHRHFVQLHSNMLWAEVRTSNIPLLRGAHKNFCTTKARYPNQKLGVEFEYMEIPITEYRRRRHSGELDGAEEL